MLEQFWVRIGNHHTWFNLKQVTFFFFFIPLAKSSFKLRIYANVTPYPQAGPHYLNLLHHSWPSDRLVVSLTPGQGYFTFLYKHTKHNIHNREGGRKEEQTIMDLGSLQAQEERSLWHFPSILCFYGLSLACIRAKFPHSHQECLSYHVGQPGLWVHRSQQSPFSERRLPPDFSWLLSPAYCLLLLTSLSCWLPCSLLFSAFFYSVLGPYLPSSSSGLVGDLVR